MDFVCRSKRFADIVQDACIGGEIGAAVDDLFDADAIEGLAGHYVERQVMRDVILVLQRGVQNACEHRAAAVSGVDVAEAIRYWAANAPRRS